MPYSGSIPLLRPPNISSKDHYAKNPCKYTHHQSTNKKPTSPHSHSSISAPSSHPPLASISRLPDHSPSPRYKPDTTGSYKSCYSPPASPSPPRHPISPLPPAPLAPRNLPDPPNTLASPQFHTYNPSQMPLSPDQY